MGWTMSSTRQKISGISFDIACEYGELIEAILFEEKEFNQKISKSPFLWEVIGYGERMEI
jgi:hypothetical protein